jgi:predicted PurR-regulated permease PerM
MTDGRALVSIALLALGGWLLYQLAPILTPFLTGALLAYVFNPLVERLAHLRLPRVLAVVAVFAVIVVLVGALIAVIVPMLERSLAGFAARLPGYLALMEREWLPRLQALLGQPLDAASIKETVQAHWKEIGAWLQGALLGLTRSGLGVVGALVNLVLVPVVTLYLLLDWQQVLAAARRILPAAAAPRVLALARESDEVLASFLRGQLAVMAVLAAFYSFGLWLTGLELAVPIGLTAGVVSFVPYLGFLTGLGASLIAGYVQFQDPAMLIWIGGVFIAGQLLEGLFLTPRLVGARIGLHPVAVIFAVMAGGQLFGFFGILLALPSAAVLAVWLRHLPELYARGAARRTSRRGRS